MHLISYTIKLSILLLLLLCVFVIPITKFSLNNYTSICQPCEQTVSRCFFLVASGDDPTNNSIPTHLWLEEIPLHVSTFRGFNRCYLIWWTPWWRRWLPWVTWQTWIIYSLKKILSSAFTNLRLEDFDSNWWLLHRYDLVRIVLPRWHFSFCLVRSAWVPLTDERNGSNCIVIRVQVCLLTLASDLLCFSLALRV